MAGEEVAIHAVPSRARAQCFKPFVDYLESLLAQTGA